MTISLAKITNNIVENVILLSDEFIENYNDYINNSLGLDGEWIKVNENHNMVGIGSIYLRDKNIFIKPKPAEWFILDENSLDWICPENINIFTGKELSEEELLLKKIKDDIIKKVKMQRLV